MNPLVMRSSTSHSTSAPYPSSSGRTQVWPAGQSAFVVQVSPTVVLQCLGTGSLPAPRFQSFLAGSASCVTVITAGVFVLSTVRIAPFQVPKTALGGIAMPPDCQSPALL